MSATVSKYFEKFIVYLIVHLGSRLLFRFGVQSRCTDRIHFNYIGICYLNLVLNFDWPTKTPSKLELIPET